MAFPLSVNLSYGMEKQETSDQRHKLGTRATTPDGRVFYYARNGSAAITTAGMIVDAAAAFAIAAHDMDVPANANAAGTTAVSVEVPTTDLTKDQYADGYLIFNDGPGEGEVYRIKGHPAHDASDDNTVIITIDEPDGLATATTTSSLFGIFVNPYSAVKLIDGDGTMETGALGVTTIPMTASYYGWIQTAGIGSVAIGAVVGIIGDGLQISQASGESGRAELYDLSGEDDLQSIGTAIGIPSVDTDKQACMLTIRY
jgi:hypothetical protein|tara:strand:- start:1255 stop:2025 length:771 start_codon:yes stop_codon:yes gene_type:complete